MNSINIIGRVDREPETRQTPSGHTVVNFTVQVDREKGRDWFRVSAWGKLSERAAKVLKDELVAVSGVMQNRRYKDKQDQWKDSWQIEASQVVVLTNGYQGEAGPGADARLHDRADEHDGVPF